MTQQRAHTQHEDERGHLRSGAEATLAGRSRVVSQRRGDFLAVDGSTHAVSLKP